MGVCAGKGRECGVVTFQRLPQVTTGYRRSADEGIEGVAEEAERGRTRGCRGGVAVEIATINPANRRLRALV